MNICIYIYLINKTGGGADVQQFQVKVLLFSEKFPYLAMYIDVLK